MAVIGYGVIGRRVVRAVTSSPDLDLAGVLVHRPSAMAALGARRRLPLFAEPSDQSGFAAAGLPVEGDLPALLDRCEVIADCTPRGVGAGLLTAYRRANRPVVFQGGETHDLTGHTFFPAPGGDDLIDRDSTRIPSCNTVGILRLLSALEPHFGLRRVGVTIVRCGSDPDKATKGDALGLIPTLGPSHHATDVERMFPDVRCTSTAITAPTNRGHVIALEVDCARRPRRDEVEAVFCGAAGVLVCDGAALTSTAALRDLGRQRGDPWGDVAEVVIWRESLRTEGLRLRLLAAIHMESIVIPETLIALRRLGLRRFASASPTEATALPA